MTRQDFPAGRGDLAVIEQKASATYLKGGGIARNFFAVALVTSVTRDGQVKKYRVAGSFYESKNTPDRVLIVRQEDLVTTQAFEDLAARCKEQWNANEFVSLDAVRDFLQPYKRQGGPAPAKESVRPSLTA